MSTDFFLTLLLGLFIGIMFELISAKERWEKEVSNTFECGFEKYWGNHYGFSVHYYLLGLIFLFLDLELCLILPFFLETIMDPNTMLMLFLFVVTLLIGLIEEWAEAKLDWLD